MHLNNTNKKRYKEVTIRTEMCPLEGGIKMYTLSVQEKVVLKSKENTGFCSKNKCMKITFE